MIATIIGYRLPKREKWLRVFVVTIIVVAAFWHWNIAVPRHTSRFGEQSWMSDYYLYYEAGRGNLKTEIFTNIEWLDHKNRIIYPSITHYLWTPWTWFGTFQETSVYHYSFLVFCYTLLVLKLCRRKYGWIFAIIGIKALYWSLDFGNVYPFLTLLSSFPLLLTISLLVKPVFGVVVVAVWGRGILDAHEKWKNTPSYQ